MRVVTAMGRFLLAVHHDVGDKLRTKFATKFGNCNAQLEINTTQSGNKVCIKMTRL